MTDSTAQIQDFVRLLAQKYQPLQIISFGSQHSFSRHSGCFAPDRQEAHEQHFLLMVTEGSSRAEHEVQDFANHHYRQGTVVMLVYGRESVQEAIGANSRFFITVYNRGILLYRQDGIAVLDRVPAFLPEGAAAKAQKHFDYRWQMAGGFLHAARESMDCGHFNIGTFLLHQVVEQCTAGLIRVFMAYRSDLHSLRRQLLLCNCFSPLPSRFFLNGNAEDERLFDILAKSYIQGRYVSSFQVQEDDAARLLLRVSEFLEMAKGMCVKKIGELEKLLS